MGYNNKKVIYTVILNNYDKLNEPYHKQPGFDYFCFTDNKNLKSDIWKFIYMEGDVKKQREIKILAHKYLKEYELTVYIDGSHQLKDISPLLKAYKGGIFMAQHYSRRCVYRELSAVLSIKKADRSTCNAQLQALKKSGVRANTGLWETGFMIRDKSKQVINLCEKWYEILEKYTHRDQLSLPHAVHLTKAKIISMRAHVVRRHFTIHPHNNPKKLNGQAKVNHEPSHVWTLQPFDPNKNFGKEINYQIEKIPDNDWILLRDQDSMLLTPNAGKQIYDIINGEGKDFSLLGCMTNRLRGMHQCYDGKFCNEHDIEEIHYPRAVELEMTQYGKVEELVNKGVAGLFMLFPKKVWNRVKFIERTHSFDTHFNRGVKQIGGKIGLIKGIYVYHSYRIWSKTPLNDVKHLV